MTYSLPGHVLGGLTALQRRVWLALVVRERAIAWGGDHLRFMTKGELAAAASMSTWSVVPALRALVDAGVVEVVQRFVPARWSGDETQILDRRDPWHPTRIADDYRLILPETTAGQGGTLEKQERPRTVLETPNGPNHNDTLGSDRNG